MSDYSSASSPRSALEGASRSCYSHGLVPKNINLAENFSKSNREAPPTTMMIRNIPSWYAQKAFVREFESMGFSGSYDFVYLPTDKRTHLSVGYCFVNFVDHHWAARCAEFVSELCISEAAQGQNQDLQCFCRASPRLRG